MYNRREAFFGLTAAIYLSKISKSVKVFEKSQSLLSGATKYNHNRHHFGFHYPRSLETAIQCLSAKKDFDRYYKSTIDHSFENFYAISRKNSKISSGDFEKFCKKSLLKFQNVETPIKLFNDEFISKTYLVNEGVYDFNKIKEIILKSKMNKKISKS